MLDIDKYLEEEWQTESLDSVIFNLGYNQEEQNSYKELFKKHFFEIADLKEVSIEEIGKYDQYSGSTLDELKNNTSYMKKNIDYIASNLENLPPPMFLYKNNELKILGGRTRTSVSRILEKNSITAYVIDYQKMLPFFHKIRENQVLTNGYGIFAIEDNKSLNAAILSAARDIRDNIELRLDRIKNKITILEESDENIKKIISDLSEYLYGNSSINKKIENKREENLNNFLSNSVAKDSYGNPLVVYHGTNADFNEFRPEQIGSNYNADKYGFFFTTDPKEASDYAEGAASYKNKGAATVYPVYLDIKNPFIQEALYCNAHQCYDLRDGLLFDSLEAKGYDGIIIKNIQANKDELKEAWKGANDGGDLYVVFKPNQIKSIYDVNFDKTNNLLNEKGDEIRKKINSIKEIEKNIATENIRKFIKKENLSLKV